MPSFTNSHQQGVTHRASLLPDTGFVRLPQILAVFPIGRSSWWAGVASGKYPASVRLSNRTSAWRVEDIRALIDRVANDAGGAA